MPISKKKKEKGDKSVQCIKYIQRAKCTLIFLINLQQIVECTVLLC